MRGESLELGGARLDILNPPRTPFEESNDNSVTFVLSYEGTKALFQGDASMMVEDELAFPDVDILMVGHHGSRFSTTEAPFTRGEARNGSHLLRTKYLRSSQP